MTESDRAPNSSAWRRLIAVWASLAALLTLTAAAEASSFLFKDIPQSRVNSAEVEQGRQIVTSLYAKWQVGTFEPVSEEFSAEMQKGLTPQLQQQAFQQIRGMFGDYQGLTFVEAMAPRFFFPRGTVYRFKGKYSKTSDQPEIRVVFDSGGKVSGLWIKPWNDELQ
jgi:hypothetical protein